MKEYKKQNETNKGIWSLRLKVVHGCNDNNDIETSKKVVRNVSELYDKNIGHPLHFSLFQTIS